MAHEGSTRRTKQCMRKHSNQRRELRAEPPAYNAKIRGGNSTMRGHARKG